MEVSIYSVALLCVLLWCVVYVCLRTGWGWVSTPVGLSVKKLRGEYMANVLTYSVSAAAPVDGDVVTRLLTLVVNGEDQGTAELPATAADNLSVFSVPQDAEVVLTLVDVDDAGNKSEPAVLTFTATDTIPPQQPGALGVTLVSEEA
jgi:hypothetical protein